MGLPEHVLTATELQVGGDCDLTIETLANIPDLFFMRALDTACVGTADEPLGIEITPIPPVLASSLVRWWCRATTLCPP